MTLSPSQLAAVQAPEARVAVVAGAGSGKTRVLTARVEHLLVKLGVLPERIVVLTFTRAAAAELRARVAALVSPEAAAALFCGTFHGLAFQLLQRHPEWAGRTAGWVLWEPADVATAVERAAQDAGARVYYVRGSDPKRVDVGKTLAKSPRASCCYRDLLRRANALDYDGLERAVVEAAGDYELDGLWDHVLVDEAQDCSPAQWEFVRYLAAGTAPGKGAHVYVVGDPRQSIYRFRGAAPEELTASIASESWTTYHLSTNYRSRPGIVAAANRIARAMGLGLPDCEAAREDDGTAGALHRENEAEEAAADIRYGIDHLDNLPRDVAVLARRWRDLDAVETAFRARGIPCRRLRRPADPFDSAEGRVVLAALRLCVDPHDDLSAEVLGAALGEDVGAARLRAATERRPLLECMSSTPFRAALAPLYILPTASEVADSALSFLRGYDRDSPVLRALRAWEHGRDRFASQPADFLAARAAASQDEPAALEDADAVTLSTVHSAKGLEWPVCYVVGCAEGAWPTASAAGKPDDLAEERRLFYVACTRARDHLVVASPATRPPYPGAAPEPCEPSRFVREMEG